MTAIRVPVEVPGGVYEVWIGPGVLGEVGPRMREVLGADQLALVTDENVAALCGVRVDTSLATAGFEVVPMKVPAGESSKSWRRCGELLDALAGSRIGRQGAVVALGGGVIGDLAGFAAAVYLRGIDLAQIPTTLLAMVDSSVGGKTAVDLTAGKNLAGAFKQPLIVLADTELLSTLPDREWKSGMAEVAKSAVIDGEDFTCWLESSVEALDSRAADAVTEMVSRCVRFKARVVGADERESGPRECLNYGHTLGHALEKVLGYGVISHGAAVAEGIRFAARVAIDVVGASAESAKRQDRLLDSLGLKAGGFSADPEELLDAMHSDKKVRDKSVRMVLVTSPGSWSCETVPDAVIAAHLDAWVSTRKGE